MMARPITLDTERTGGGLNDVDPGAAAAQEEAAAREDGAKADQPQEPVEIRVEGWRARIMQHEFDHLNGILYVDRLSDSDWKTTQKIARKRGWGKPGQSWMPGVDDLDA